MAVHSCCVRRAKDEQQLGGREGKENEAAGGKSGRVGVARLAEGVMGNVARATSLDIDSVAP